MAAEDTFTGYFIAGLFGQGDVLDIPKLASAASAITVSRKGAAPSILCIDEVLATVDTLKPRAKND